MRIALVGDTAFFGKFSADNNPDIYSYFEEVKDLLKQFDLVVANLETPFINGQKTFGNKSAYLGSSIRNIELLKYIGINIVNLANNHIFDYGKGGFGLTKRILDENRIAYFGVEGKNVKIELNGNRIAFSGYCCYSTNPVGIGKDGINELNYSEVKKSLINCHKEGYNNILSIHTGQEHINYPNYDHINFARGLTEFAPYVYYGHHPHVLQGVEEFNDSLIAYSLGNFCFDDVYTVKSKEPLIKQGDNNKSSVILSLEYNNNKLVSHSYIPIFQAKERLRIDKVEILNDLMKYSEMLNLEKSKYIIMRNAMFNNYIQSRKQLRNFQWYWKRLNIKSILMILSSRRNRRKYQENLKRYL